MHVLNAEELEKQIHKNAPKFSVAAMLLRVAASNPKLRFRLLEFVDVLPSHALRANDRVRYYFLLHMREFESSAPFVLRVAIRLAKRKKLGLVAGALIKWTIVNKLAPYFIVSGKKRLRRVKHRYQKDNCRIIADFLGEVVTNEEEAMHFNRLYRDAAKDPRSYRHIAVKLSSLYTFFTPDNYENAKKEAGLRLAGILKCAKENNIRLTVDAEHYDLRELVEDTFLEVICKNEFADMQNVGIALQAYTPDSLAHAEKLVKAAKKRGTPFHIRLVKGAYWDTELALADQRGWPAPVWRQKRLTDYNFELVLHYLFGKWPLVYTSPATHNPRSIAYAANLAKQFGIIKDKNFEFQVLYGLGEPIRAALVKNNLPVAVYTPIGDLVSGMSYFARRILENTSNEGFLLQLIDKGGSPPFTH